MVAPDSVWTPSRFQHYVWLQEEAQHRFLPTPQHQWISFPLAWKIVDRDLILKSCESAGVKDFAGDEYGRKSNEANANSKPDHTFNRLGDYRAAQN